MKLPAAGADPTLDFCLNREPSPQYNIVWTRRPALIMDRRTPSALDEAWMAGLTNDRRIVGWREWASLPLLGIPALKAKIDTGARTSALHTFDLEHFEKDGRGFVRFGMHPLRRRRSLVIRCQAEVVDKRVVSDSGGHRESRFVIESPLRIGDETWTIELTLTNRDTMLFPLLVGRTAMRGRLVVDPDRSYTQGRGLGRIYDKEDFLENRGK